ncbi:MAG: hypothetical protein IKD04_05675 [Clostridia bacterium]|nr:hypothetical protein [Clostridia bacterium]
MKKLFAIVLCLILITTLFYGCNSVAGSSDKDLSSDLSASTGDGGEKNSGPEQTVSNNVTDTSTDTALLEESTPTEETSTPVETEEKKYSTATIDQDFADNEILVFFPKTTDIEEWKREYTVEDFPEIECVAVENDDCYIREIVLGQDQEKAKEYMEKSQRCITIKLKEKSKENVLEMIRILEKNDDFDSVEPKYLMRHQ